LTTCSSQSLNCFSRTSRFPSVCGIMVSQVHGQAFGTAISDPIWCWSTPSLRRIRWRWRGLARTPSCST